MNDIIPQKQCCTCKQFFPPTTDFFQHRKSEKDGLRKQCKACTKITLDKSRAKLKASPIVRPPVRDGYKICSYCKQEKLATADQFNKSSKGKYGLSHVCKECWKPYTTELAEKKAQAQQGKTRQCTACKQVYPATLTYFFKEGPGLCTRCKACRMSSSISYMQEHKEERKAKRKVYRANNVDLILIHDHNRRARIAGATGKHTAQDIQDQYRRQKGKCYWCSCKLGKKRSDYHIDHVVPLSRGGSNGPENLVVSCHSCNESRRNKLPSEWIKGGRLL